MKGVVLAGGLGTRLEPLTLVSNKHLLPVYNKPMIYYPIQTLIKAGITEIMIIVSGIYSGDFIKVLKNGEEFGLKRLVYGYQEKPNGGIADALSIAKSFVGNDCVTVILGDNTTDADISMAVKTFDHRDKKCKAKIFLKKVNEPSRYGVPQFKGKKIKKVLEKPKTPPSNYAVTGIYIYDCNVFKFINKCSPSQRGELEITDVNNFYIENDGLEYDTLNGFWCDAGTFDSLFLANKHWAEIKK